MTFVLVGRVQAEYPLAKGLFLPKALLKKTWAIRKPRRTQLVQQEETNCVFLQFIFKQTFTKRNIGEPVPLLKSHPYFLSPDVNEFL